MILRSEAEVRRWFGEALGCDENSLRRLARLEALLRSENTRQNLVSAASLAGTWVRHFADSAQLLLHVPRETPIGPWLDLGTGAGFPGLVVACCRPEWRIVAVESRSKRIEWLQSVAEALDLGRFEVAGQPLERLETFDAAVISARAFAPLPRLISLSARFSTPRTRWLLPKGRKGRQELESVAEGVRRMFHVEQSLTDAESVVLVGNGRIDPSKRAA